MTISRIHPESEITRDPIFLFQVKRYIYHGEPDGYEWGGEDWYPEGNPEGAPLSSSDLESLGAASSYWDAERVFFTREEGEQYGRDRHYNYPDGWRVYCVCSEGVLAELLKSRTVREPYQDRTS